MIDKTLALGINNLCKSYTNFQLDNVNIKVPKGRIVGLIGENGAGKSTLMKASLNLVNREKGDITFWGKELTEKTKYLKEDIGVMFDEINFWETLTPKDIGKISASSWKNWDASKYQSYLKQFSLDDKKKIKDFSKGMQVKLNLSVALSHNAKLLMLDEPTSGLDPVVRDSILDVFLEHVQEEENSILMSSHITDDLEKIADYIIFIHKGKIVFQESKDEIIYNYGILRCKEAEKSKINKDDIIAFRKSGFQWDILVRDKHKAAAKYPDIILDDASLNEIMLIYVKGETK